MAAPAIAVCSSIRKNAKESIFSPLVLAFGALKESRHGLIGRSDLQLEEICFVVTAVVLWTLSGGLIDVLPGSFTTQNIVHFLSRKNLSFEHQEPGDLELVRTSRAVELVAGILALTHKKHVGAVGAERKHDGVSRSSASEIESV